MIDIGIRKNILHDVGGQDISSSKVSRVIMEDEHSEQMNLHSYKHQGHTELHKSKSIIETSHTFQLGVYKSLAKFIMGANPKVQEKQ